jgi:transposase
MPQQLRSFIKQKYMSENSVSVGIDVSKDVFDVFCETKGHRQYSNNEAGFKAFTKSLDADNHSIMEATGSYHYPLAVWLYDYGFKVSVMNPVVIKRYREMRMSFTKNDRTDTWLICQYGIERPPALWKPAPDHVEHCRMAMTVVELYYKQSTALKNKLHSMDSRGQKTGSVVNSIRLQIRRIEKEVDKLMDGMEELIKEHEAELYTHIRSIPGIGLRTSMMIIAVTNGFRDFDNHRQVSSFVGLAPIERTSGSSIRGRSRISKAGSPLLRSHLFMCSFTASQYNPQCRALYERIIAKGKTPKLALIAVCNKLLKQALAVSKNRMPYDPNYRSVKPTA